MTKPKSNVFTHTVGIVAREGLHPQAIVTSTEHIGKRQTKYGPKDFQMFHLQVKQFSDDGTRETAEIHQQYHRSFGPRSSLTAFLAGFGVNAQPGMTYDFDDLVGKQVSIVVTHTIDSNGSIHANIKVLPPRARGVQ